VPLELNDPLELFELYDSLDCPELFKFIDILDRPLPSVFVGGSIASYPLPLLL